MNRIIVTGGAGFIGSALVRWLIRETGDTVCVLDKLTYAGNPDALAEVAADPRYNFVKMDICDRAGVRKLFADFKPTHIMHLAAESHVDRSIASGEEFIRTNIDGTFNLLEAAREYGKLVMFHHISTDEVYGDLQDGAFTEESPVRPSSPYSASKAAADHLVRAWYRTYGLPTIVTNCSNNFGPWQHPEKLIPLHDPPCRHRAIAADLRQRMSGAGLAVCGRPCPRTVSCGDARQSGQHLQHRSKLRIQEYRSCEKDLRHTG